MDRSQFDVDQEVAQRILDSVITLNKLLMEAASIGLKVEVEVDEIEMYRYNGPIFSVHANVYRHIMVPR